MHGRAFLWVSLLFCCAPPCLAGDDLFRIDASTTSGSSLQRSVSASDLLSLGNDVIKAQGDFAQFEGRDFAAAVRYAGIPDAVNVSVNAAGTHATLRIPSTGLVK